jgi:hypothetical protein
MDTIENEIQFYKSHRLELIEQYQGKHLAIKGMQIIGVYNTNSEAQNETSRLHEKGTYIIEHPVDLTIQRTSIKRKLI